MKSNKFTIVTVVMLMVSSFSFLKAEPVDSTLAKTIAQHFFQSLPVEQSRLQTPPTIAYTSISASRNDISQREKTYFYIVNVGENGYVIVAGDDRVSPVLGYSTTSSFDGQRMPSNMEDFLEEYQEQMEELDRQQLGATPSVMNQWYELKHSNYIRQHRNVVVAPLVTSTWGQGQYYNALCPAESQSVSGHAVTGCAAVVMGQIMRYWHAPEHGNGSHSYVSNNSYQGSNYGDYGIQTADFSNTTYDYNNMPNVLNANSSPTEINAVATLLYHCGVSLNMAYGITASTAYISDIDDALRDYFYFEDVQHIHRSIYFDSDWLNMLKNELDHWRPMIYSGYGQGSSHVFICDGYDDLNFFHMNW